MLRLAFVPLLLAAAAAAPPRAQPQSAAALPAPQLFAEGTISTPDDEMDAGFTADGRTLYFTKNHQGQRLGVIVVSHLQGDRWSEPEVAPFSGRYTDYDPFVTADGSKIFFASNRPTTGTTKKDFDIWMVERSGSGWGTPVNVGDPINTSSDEFYPTLASDGTLYFSATRPDTKGRSDIYRARRQADGKFGPPENLGDAINSPATEVDSYIAPDQSFVVFAGIGRPDDMGGGDLYISRQTNGVWSKAVHLGAGINTSTREYCPSASPDGRYFFFTSFRGFGDRVPERGWSFADFRRGMASVLNGWGNVYRIEMSALQ